MIRQGAMRLIGISLLLLCLGCSTLNGQWVIQDADVALVRELMEPVYTGQEGLIETLGVTDHDRVIFRVKNQEVVRARGPLSTPDIWSQENLIFFRIAEPNQDHRLLYYFDPQTFRLVPLKGQGDGIDKQPRIFTLFKAFPHDDRWIPGDQTLSLMRLNFEYTPSGEIRYLGKNRVSGIQGDPSLPVYLREKGVVFFLTRKDQGPYGLISVDQEGENLKEHILGESGHITRIYSEDGKTLIFESDKKGYQSLFRLNPDDGEVTDYIHGESAGGGEGRYILTSRFAYGASSPVIVKIPEAMDMGKITSLVMAQNPKVAMKRALFAASLVEAGIATLSNYPSFYFELGTISPAGLLSNQGGFASQTLINGLLGFVQPLFDIKRNTELGRAAELTAETAKNRLDNEINERVAEAMGLYFDITYLNEMDAVWKESMTIYENRARHYASLKTVGDAYGLQLLAADKIIVAGRAEQEHNRRRVLYLMRRLKSLCGLSQGIDMTLANEAFRMDEAAFGDEGELHDLAVLNHPQIKAASSELKKAYFLESAGPLVRGKMNLSAEYEYAGRGASNVVTDNINLTLGGSISSAHKRSARLHLDYWARIKDSLRIRLGMISGEVRLSLEEALMDFKAAKDDYLAKRADTRYYLEKIRVARLYESIDTLEEGGKNDPLSVNTAVQEYLSSLARLAEVRRDLGVRYVNVWRETGRSQFLSEEMKGFTSERLDRQRASLWLWKTGEVMDSPAKMAEFLRLAEAANIKRVYAYLYSDSRLLTDVMARERFTLFLNACTQEGIEVWALLGEPDWLKGGEGEPNLTRALHRIIQFNASKNGLEPKISGVKLDLEPHSIQGWEKEGAARMALNSTYLRLLESARIQLRSRLPLWVDCPVKYFTREENRALMGQIVRLTDGITVMVYFNTPEKIIAAGKTVLREASGPMEIGLEFSATAPASDTLYPLTKERWRQVVESVSRQFIGISGYMGLSFHDNTALKLILDGDSL